MNQQTSQTADQPTSHPPDEPTSHPRKKNSNKKKKKKHVSTWIALASAATAIIAAAISGYQVRIADKQNTQAEQTQLATLTALIAQQFATANSARSPLSAWQIAAGVERLSVYGQAGSVLIHDLKGIGVASMEYIEVGRALDYSGATAGAIPYYKDAITAPPYVPYTRAQAMRYLGAIYYNLGSNAIAHQYMMRATKVYRGHPLEYKSTVANVIAQGYAEDAYWQAYLNCRIAAADMKAARLAIVSYSTPTIIQSWLTSDENAYKSKCSGSG
jgi:tetratricopeptide (TPR) repeat protein